MQGEPSAPLRRDQVLAYIIECIVRYRAAPTYNEISRALDMSENRAKELVAQLISRGFLEKVPGATRGLRVRDVTGSRIVLDDVLRQLGWIASDPMGDLRHAPLPDSRLTLIPPFEHLPDAA